jgi:hypothetical protein
MNSPNQAFSEEINKALLLLKVHNKNKRNYLEPGGVGGKNSLKREVKKIKPNNLSIICQGRKKLAVCELSIIHHPPALTVPDGKGRVCRGERFIVHMCAGA